MNMEFFLDPNRCIGCQSCVAACSECDTHRGHSMIHLQYVERPISVIDFMATVCRALGIDYAKKNETPGGRPVGVVDKGAKPIAELFAG